MLGECLKQLLAGPEEAPLSPMVSAWLCIRDAQAVKGWLSHVKPGASGSLMHVGMQGFSIYSHPVNTGCKIAQNKVTAD